MIDRRRQIEAQLMQADQVVPEPIAPGVGIAHPGRPGETMHPTQEGQAKRPLSGLAKFFVNVTLLASEAREPWIEAEPGVFVTGEDAQALHRDLERFALGILAALVGCPDAVHAGGPDRREVCRDSLEIVVDQRPLEQVPALGPPLGPGQEPIQGSGKEQDMGVGAYDPGGVGMTKDQVPNRRATGVTAR